MKKIFIIIFLVFLVIIGYSYFFPNLDTLPSSPLPASSPQPNITHLMTKIFYQNQTYYYDYFPVNDLAKLTLHPNYQQQLDTQALIKKHQCQNLINAGFYGQSNQPLGLFIANSKLISKQIKSSLFNGFLIMTGSDPVIPQISATFTSFNPRIALQSGPLLYLDSQPLLLSIKSDEPRRRSIAFINQDDQLFFLIITGQDSSFSGPLLSNTPQVLKTISQNINQPIKSAINLDGGSASSFYTSDLHLKEFSFIGSFFCLN
ncbi:phosphodiester glycosidase family protein [Patescibacteria group bacterium]